ncbi:hypothetical protein L9F63_012929, partial [Diploptera punctata]
CADDVLERMKIQNSVGKYDLLDFPKMTSSLHIIKIKSASGGPWGTFVLLRVTSSACKSEGLKVEMSLDSMRGTYGRCPPFLVAGLFVVCIILTFNCSEEQELCVQQRLSAEQRLKTMEEEMAQLRVQVDRERGELQKVKNSLSTQEEEVKKTKKQQEDIQKSASMCNTELTITKQTRLEIFKEYIIQLELVGYQWLQLLRSKKRAFHGIHSRLETLKIYEAKTALQAANKKPVILKKSQAEKSSTVPPQKPAADDGIAVGGNHGQEVVENEENNAGERDDDVNLEEGGGDNMVEGPEPRLEDNRV